MSKWVVLCSDMDREVLGRLVRSIDGDGQVIVAKDADDLRRMVLGADPGEYGVVVGPLSDGVSDVNLAAAVANDGNARTVVLARPDASGSLRSRSARAGIDLVVDLSEFGEGDGLEPGPLEGDGGRLEGLPAPSPSPLEMDDISPRSPVIVFCSGRGGVGKTALSAASSVVAARWGMRTCLVDLDLSCGNAYSCFGLSGGSDLAVLNGAQRASDERLGRLCRSAAPGVSMMGPCGRPETAELAMPGVTSVLDYASREFDLVIVDTSTTFTDAVAQAAQRADRLVIVSDGGTGSLTAMARMAGLAVRLGVARTRIARLENRADPRSRSVRALGMADVGLEAARSYRVSDGGREVGDLLAAGQVCDLVGPGYSFSDSVSVMLAQLLAELGRLPDNEDARRASEERGQRGWRGLFAGREARRA